MLARCGIITPDVARKLSTALLEFARAGPEVFELDPAREDAYFNYEAKVIEKTGADVGGRMHIGPQSQRPAGGTRPHALPGRLPGHPHCPERGAPRRSRTGRNPGACGHTGIHAPPAGPTNHLRLLPPGYRRGIRAGFRAHRRSLSAHESESSGCRGPWPGRHSRSTEP